MVSAALSRALLVVRKSLRRLVHACVLAASARTRARWWHVGVPVVEVQLDGAIFGEWEHRVWGQVPQRLLVSGGAEHDRIRPVAVGMGYTSARTRFSVRVRTSISNGTTFTSTMSILSGVLRIPPTGSSGSSCFSHWISAWTSRRRR
jgi:hypothetical protein